MRGRKMVYFQAHELMRGRKMVYFQAHGKDYHHRGYPCSARGLGERTFAEGGVLCKMHNEYGRHGTEAGRSTLDRHIVKSQLMDVAEVHVQLEPGAHNHLSHHLLG